ncbi:hypothetical protein M3F63_02305, partial [Brachybacterium muris]|uniref:hypothetical protein n=1 Tax=Brachybacterium muris TaxID=219301 RepID=UPI00223B4057
DESAAAVKKLPMTRNSATGLLHGTLRAADGKFAKNLQFDSTAALSLTNPAMLAMLGVTMLQMAAEQSMEKIQEYLEAIDAKVDDVLRAQKDAVLADMIGVDLLLDEAMTVRAEVGHVSAATWSKVQSTPFTIARTQAYALRQLDALANRIESTNIKEMASTVSNVEPDVRNWLHVIAHCSHLQDGLIVLELDHVLESDPDHIDEHRQGLAIAKQNRLAALHRSTELILERMNGVGELANAKVLLSPRAARTALTSSTTVTRDVLEFQTALDIEDGHESPEAKRGRAAAGEARTKAIEAGVDGLHSVKDFGTGTADRVRDGAGRLSLGARAFREAVRKEHPRDSEE